MLSLPYTTPSRRAGGPAGEEALGLAVGRAGGAGLAGPRPKHLRPEEGGSPDCSNCPQVHSLTMGCRCFQLLPEGPSCPLALPDELRPVHAGASPWPWGHLWAALPCLGVLEGLCCTTRVLECRQEEEEAAEGGTGVAFSSLLLEFWDPCQWRGEQRLSESGVICRWGGGRGPLQCVWGLPWGLQRAQRPLQFLFFPHSPSTCRPPFAEMTPCDPHRLCLPLPQGPDESRVSHKRQAGS